MKIYAILLAFIMIFSIASFVIAESGSDSNESDSDLDDSDDDLNDSDDSGNDSSSDLDDSDDDLNETDDDSSGKFRERIRTEMKDGREEIRYELRNGSERFEFRQRMKDGREEIRMKIRDRNVTFNYTDDDKLQFMVGKINARTGLNLSVDDLDNVSLGQVLRAYLSNGRWAEVKYMPDQASEIALERLEAKCEERNCTVELREINNSRTNKTRIVYEVETEKGSKVFFMFKNKMKVKAVVDAETGEVISSHKPWWAFLASEKDESDDDDLNESDDSGNDSSSDLDDSDEDSNNSTSN